MRDRSTLHCELKFTQHARQKAMPKYTPTKITDTRLVVRYSAEGAVRWALIHLAAKQIEDREANG